MGKRQLRADAAGALAGEREVLEPRRRRTVVEWAEAHRILEPRTSAIPGRWSWKYVLFLVEPAEAMTDPAVRTITIKKCGQAGGTELTNNIIGWVIDESPCPMHWELVAGVVDSHGWQRGLPHRVSPR